MGTVLVVLAVVVGLGALFGGRKGAQYAALGAVGLGVVLGGAFVVWLVAADARENAEAECIESMAGTSRYGSEEYKLAEAACGAIDDGRMSAEAAKARHDSIRAEWTAQNIAQAEAEAEQAEREAQAKLERYEDLCNEVLPGLENAMERTAYGYGAYDFNVKSVTERVQGWCIADDPDRIGFGSAYLDAVLPGAALTARRHGVAEPFERLAKIVADHRGER